MIASIDTGTSYSSICILGPDGKAQPVDISTGASMFGSKYSLPSAIFVEDGGNVLVGQAAMNSRKHKPQNFRMEFKRNLGEDIPILLGERSFKPEDLYTELFRHMKACAEQVGGGLVEKTYLTYPASYEKRRKEKLRSAAGAAGLFEIELVDEPTAAAMCYCAQGYIQDGQTLLVYDFGGGTFDVSLIKYQNGEFHLLSEPAGLERCGGMDIDYLIAQDMRATIETKIPGAWESLQKNPGRFLRFTSQLSELAVKAKHHLSAAGIFEEYIEIGMDDVSYKLTAERFNKMIAPLVDQTVQTCRRALDEAGVSASEVSAVLLVGGTSRIPLVKEMAKKITGRPALCAADLELAVAQGALVYQKHTPGITKAPKGTPDNEAMQILCTPSSPPTYPERPTILTFPNAKDKALVWEFYKKNSRHLLSGSAAIDANHRAIFFEDGTYLDNIASMDCCGTSKRVYLRTDGTVIAEGYDLAVQSKVQSWANIASIACESDHILGLHSDGTMVFAGNSFRGSSNIDTWTKIVSFVCNGWNVIGLRKNGKVLITGNNTWRQCNVQTWDNIVSIVCSSFHVVGLRADGTVVAAGNNNDGQCRVQTWTNIVSVACGRFHTVGLRADGTVVATGRNTDGECDVQTWEHIVSIISDNFTAGLRADGTVISTGLNNYGQCNTQSFRDVIAINVFNGVVALQKDGSIVQTRGKTIKPGVYQPFPPKVLPYKLF